MTKISESNGIGHLMIIRTWIEHDAVRLHVPALWGLLVANGASHWTTDHFVHATHSDAILRHSSRCTTNALRTDHVHVNGLDAAEWWHSSPATHDVATRAIFSTVPNARMNCIGGVLYALHSVSSDAF